MIYKLILSTKEEMNVSQAEFNYFKDNMSANFIELESGIINPSFVVSVIINEELSKIENENIIKKLLKEDSSEEDKTILKNYYVKSENYGVKELHTLLQNYKTKLLK